MNERIGELGRDDYLQIGAIGNKAVKQATCDQRYNPDNFGTATFDKNARNSSRVRYTYQKAPQ